MSDLSPCQPSTEGTTVADDYSPCSVTTVSALPLFDTDFDTTALSGGVYTTYYIESHYEDDEHILQMAVMSNSSSAASFAYLASPTMKRIVKWKAEKWGEMPALPSSTAASGEVLLAKSIVTYNVEATADGVTLAYTAEGKYTYGVNDASTVSDYYFCVPPYLKDQFSSAKAGSSSFETGIIQS